MGKFKEIVQELKLTADQLANKEIRDFALQVAWRKNSGRWYQYWNGNGYCELNKDNGTMITTVLDDTDFEAEFPLNCDINISNNCCIGCPFCYQGCTPTGKHSDIRKFIQDKNSFLYSLHEGTELAINGNEPFHPDLELLLNFCKQHDIVANLTVNEISLLAHTEQIENWLKAGLIHGVGVSPKNYSDKMIEFCQKYPTAVIHTIAGVTSIDQYTKLANKKLKLLILGYKDFGRGNDYRGAYNKQVLDNISKLKNIIKSYPNMFEVVSFDNLAIEQLDPKAWLTDDQWQHFYRGDDGSHTLFIDLVSETFAKNSIQPKEKHKALLSDIKDMLKQVKNT